MPVILFYRMAQIGSVYLLLKGAAFLAVAALGWTPLPPLLLGGMALTWVAGGVLLARQARRVGRRLEPAWGAKSAEETGRLTPVPHQG